MPSTLTKASLKKSRPLDLTRWSEDQPVIDAVDALVGELRSLAAIRRMTEPRKRAVRVVILNLYLRRLEDPPGLVSYSRNKSDYNIPARYNPAEIGFHPVISIIDGLTDLGYVAQVSKGFYSRTGGRSRKPRMRATQKLRDSLEKTYGIDGSMIDVHSRSETVILRDKQKKDVSYKDSRLTRYRRDLLQDYYRLLRNKYIDIDLQGHSDHVRINLANKFVRTIFNNRSFNQGGRFYGGWWQIVPKELRTRILIKTKPTVELDFSGNQLMMAYAECGIDYFSTGKGDPYILSNYGSQHRELFKKVMIVALNSSSRRSTKAAIRNQINKGKFSLPSGRSVEDILKDFESFHSDILSQFFSGRSGHFQFLDSEVTARVIDHMTRTEDDVVLCLHDSFIFVEDKENAVRRMMAEALEDVLIEHSALPAVTPKIQNTAFWIDRKTRDPKSVYLVDFAKGENVQRWADWRQSRRQGVLVYEPTNP